MNVHATNPRLRAVGRTRFRLEGPLADYATAVADHWLKILPHSNPGLIEVLRDRDRLPRRNLMRWTGWFHGMHLISLVEMLRLTGDEELRRATEWYVARLLELQDEEDGYLGAFPKGYRYRNYAPNALGHGDICWDTSGHHYVMLGLLYWYEDSGDADVLAAARRIGDALCDRYLGAAHRMVDTGFTETNLAPGHSLMVLYRHTGEERYLALARQIVDEEFGAQGAGGEYFAGNYLEAGLSGQEFFELPTTRWEGLHQMQAMVELFYVTGDDRYATAFEHFWWSIVKTDRHNNGGFSTSERAVGSPYAPGAIESCCTLAWIAFSVDVLKLTGTSIVADELELSTLNSVVGMHSASGYWSTYDTPMDGVRKASTQDISFQAREGTPHLNCCSVHTPRGFGLVSEWALMRDDDGIVVNYYGPGSIDLPLDDGTTVTVRQETDYPRSGSIRLAVAPSSERAFAVKLRVPYWSVATQVTVDGEAVGEPQPGSYIELSRRWTGGETIELELDMSLHLWVGEERCTGRASIYRGPILLTFDRRFNELDAPDLPALDATRLDGALVETDHWQPPILLFEIATAAGPVRLCDFGSAGEGGSPYLSWLPVRNARPVEFSRTNPLRSGRPSYL